MAAVGHLDPEKVLAGRLFRDYSRDIEKRGGGEGGLIDCTNSAAVSSIGAAVLPAGNEIAAVSGRMKIAAAISASVLSSQQDIEHFIIPC
jgi:hypothetical protein